MHQLLTTYDSVTELENALINGTAIKDFVKGDIYTVTED